MGEHQIIKQRVWIFARRDHQNQGGMARARNTLSFVAPQRG